ncbi:hypothetical protein [Catenuloplanes japonicus]|uniref:hypothetical protein n=1 Tax=Catenuloplanes japonicus TaxID=33876 RepID=UPI0012F7B81A|nr:hypothetical protein [Catenuloplanes japonicus]
MRHQQSRPVANCERAAPCRDGGSDHPASALASLEIRVLTAAAHDDQSTEALDQRRERVNEIADSCHDLTRLLGPHRRDNLADGLRQHWRSAGTRQRRWLQARFDQLGYDHGRLTELTPETPPLLTNTDS